MDGSGLGNLSVSVGDDMMVLSKLSLQPRKVIPTRNISRIIFFKGTSSLAIAKVN